MGLGQVYAYRPGTSEPITKGEYREYVARNKQMPSVMTEMPIQGVTQDYFGAKVVRAWQSNKHFAALWDKQADPLRLSVNRLEIIPGTDLWKDGISWDDLMEIKEQCGFAESWATEIYPPTDKLVDVANMRHLWILPREPSYGWKETEPDGSV